MDTSTINREIEMMECQGPDPATVRETIRIQTERKARFGVVSVVCMALGLGAVALFAPAEQPSVLAASGPEAAAAAGADGIIIAGNIDSSVTTDAPLMWFPGADTLTTAAATRDTHVTDVPGTAGTH